MRQVLSLLFILATTLILGACVSTENVSSKKKDNLDSFLEDKKEDDFFSTNDKFVDAIGERFPQEAFDSKTDEIQFYQTQKNDTLMLIAFNIYGDYKKWRELYFQNKDVLGNSYDLAQRPILRYRKPAGGHVAPMGSPYLIKNGDSLSLISKKVYGDWREWPIIHQNNLEQIPKPDLIFAGFTLYYPSLNQFSKNLY